MKLARVILIILLIAGLAVGGYFLFQRYQESRAATQNIYQNSHPGER